MNVEAYVICLGCLVATGIILSFIIWIKLIRGVVFYPDKKKICRKHGGLGIINCECEKRKQ